MEVLERAIQSDHIHLFAHVWPTDSAAFARKELKGITSLYLRQEFSSTVRNLPSLWTRSSFACPVGQVSADGIKASSEGV